MKNNWKFFILFWVLWSLPACETQEDLQKEVQALIDQRLEERRKTFTATLRENCDEKILEEATRIVDSIVIAEARLRKDTIPRPFRPDRPAVPELRSLKDTTPVAPLFPDSLEADTSLPVRRPVKKN